MRTGATAKARLANELLRSLVFVIAASCGGTDTPVTSPTVRHWRVYDGKVAVLEMADAPGPLTSTAPPSPDGKPVMHPFLTASALDAGHEDQLRRLLQDATSADDFVTALERAGLRVVAE